MTSSPSPDLRPRFEKHPSGTVWFRHPCCVCGSDNAPFGYGVQLVLAMKMKDPSKAGRWYCAEHRPK